MATTEEKPEETPAVEPATADTNGTTGPDEPATNGDAPVEKKKGSSKKKGKKGKKGAKEDGAEKMEGAGGDDVEIVAEVKKKPKKNKIPSWATLSDKALAKVKPGQMTAPGGSTSINTIVEAIKECANDKGLAAYISIKKYIYKHQPSWPKMTFKTALRNAVKKGRVKQVRNSYKLVNEGKVKAEKPKAEKSKKKDSKKSSSTGTKACPLEELFPHIFTWVCEPKEASYGLIKKYIIKHFPNLNADTGLKKAMENMCLKGQLEQITGKGASGTFALENGAKKTGTAYEDPVEDAIIASNLPKDCSVASLKHYLHEYHLEYDIKNKPKVLRSALDRAESKGWIIRISGAGMSGSFRLAHDYIPSPKDLWRDDYKPSDYEPKKKKAKTYDSSDESESEEESEDSSDDDSDSEAEEVLPKSTKRLDQRKKAPARSAPAAKKTKAKPKKATPKKPAPAKKSKKATPKKGKKATPKKDKKATPKKVKKATPKDADSDDDDDAEIMPKSKKRGAPTPRKEPKKAEKATPAKKAKKAKSKSKK